MKITPLDIRRKEFKRSMRGYADEEVDIFLDEVADEFERLFQENMELHDRTQRLDEQIASHAQLKDALEKTLISAQLQAEELRANAHKESELILRDAEMKARGIVNDSYGETQRTQQALVQLKLLEEDFRFKFRSLLEGYLRLLSQAPLAGGAAEGEVQAKPAAMPEVQPEISAARPAPAPEPAPGPAVAPEPASIIPAAATPLVEEPVPVDAWPVEDDTVDSMVSAETPAFETGVTDMFAIDMVAPDRVPASDQPGDDALLPVPPAAAPMEHPAYQPPAPPTPTPAAPEPEEEAPRGFFFGRRLEDVDDTFPGDDATKTDRTRDFEW